MRRRNSVILAGHCRATGLARDGEGWRVSTSMGEVRARHVVVATNGYTSGVTPRLQKRLVPIASHIIATEELPADLIHEICVAMEFGASAQDVALTCHAHPTFSEAVREAALACGDGAIHA